MNLETTSCFKTISKKNPKLTVLNEKQVKDIQKIALETLKDILDICEEHQVTYHLTGGSALGAVRHKGFIPWDDDIDIDMSRADIEKFLIEFKRKYGNKYWIHTPYSDKKFCMPGYQIRRKGTTFQTCYDLEPEQCGIGVDIPIMENVPDSSILRKLHGMGSLFLGLAVSCRRFYENRKYLLDMVEGFAEVERVFRTKISIGFLVSFLPLDKWTRLFDKWNSLCRNKKSKYVAVPTGRKHYFGEIYPREDFAETAIATFEGLTVHIPKEYNSYLTSMYGDYMKIPSEENREQHVVIRFEINTM